MPRKKTIDIMSYSDYRELLKDTISFKRACGIRITNRSLSAMVGIKTSSWLSAVLKGKKGISDTTAAALADFIGGTRREREYFLTLVHFNQARSIDERNAWYAKMRTLRRESGMRNSVRVNEAQYDYYADWYNSVVRAILGICPECKDPGELAALLIPTITARKAKKAVKILMRTGLIEQTPEGTYRLSNSWISTGKREYSAAVSSYQRESMRLGEGALEKFSHLERDISTLTLGVSQKHLPAIKRELAECRARIAALAAHDKDADRVFQLNMQLFPVSKELGTNSDKPGKGEEQ